MPKLIIIIGLPGSGKSEYIKKMIIRGEIEESHVFDDFHDKSKNDSPYVKDSRHFEPLVESLKNDKNCLVADIAFCEKERLTALINTIEIQTKIELRYFDNNPIQCKKNIKTRALKQAEEEAKKADELSVKYQIPEDIKPITVYQDNQKKR